MSYAMQWRALGFDDVDEATCRESGGDWHEGTKKCANISRNQCEAHDGRWDPSALICHREGKPARPAPELCAEKGYAWDWERSMCRDPGSGREVPVTPGSAGGVLSSPALTVVVLGLGALGAWWMLR